MTIAVPDNDKEAMTILVDSALDAIHERVHMARVLDLAPYAPRPKRDALVEFIIAVMEKEEARYR